MPRSDSWSRDVFSAVDQDARNISQTVGTIEQGWIAEPVVRPVVRGQPHEGQPEPVVVPSRIAPHAIGTDRDVDVLPQRPIPEMRCLATVNRSN
jgi:uncharacterized caspase-like protein